MKVLLDIKDDKVAFVLELLKKFKFLKAKPISNEKAEIISSIREGVEEYKLIRKGKLKGLSAKELLDEL